MKNSLHILCTALCLILAGGSTVHAQTYSVLYQFKAGPGGTFPVAGVTLDTKRRSLYGTTENDGTFAAGTVFRLDGSGESVLHSFTGEAGDGQNPYGNGSLLLDAAGNLFGATADGGIYGGNCGIFGCGIVFKVDQSGNETVLYQFTGGTDGWSPEGPLAEDPAGNLYGMTENGGSSNAGTVFKLDQLGHEIVLHSFSFGGTDGAVPYGGFSRDNAGNLYGTTYLGGNLGSGTVFKVDPSGNESVLYSFGTNPLDGFSPANGLTLDAKGNLYGMTPYGGAIGLGTVFKVNPNGNETLLHSFGALPDAQSPVFDGVALDPSGSLYGVTNAGGAFGMGAIFKIDATGHETVIHSFSGPDGKYPYSGLARDPQGNFYGTTSKGGAFGGGVIFRIKP